jgi:lysophospholipase L1-like esterase
MKNVRQRVLFGLLAVTTAALAVDAVLAYTTLGFVKAGDEVRLDPAGLKIFADAHAKPAEVGLPVLELFGDSRAQMWSEPPPIPGYRVVNRGIGRQTTAQLLLRFGADVADVHPAVVVLEAGVNDLKTIADLPERRAATLADCEANLTTIVERSKSAGARVVLVTIFDIGDIPLWRKPFWSADVEAAVRQVNAFLPRLTDDKVVLFDANAALEAEPGHIRHEFQLDHLHLVPAGYAALNERLLPLVTAMPR